VAFNNSFTAVTGATYTAAQYNTHVRDNLTAIWVYTTAGDIAYATGATALARLGIGASGALLYSGGSAPAWLAIGSNYQYLRVASGTLAWSTLIEKSVVYKTANQSFNSASAADIIFEADLDDVLNWHNPASNPERITVGATGLYVAHACVRFVKNAGGSGSFQTQAVIRVNGATQTGNRSRLNWDIDVNPKEFNFGGIPFNMIAGDYITLNFNQDSGGSGNITGVLGETSLALFRLT